MNVYMTHGSEYYMQRLVAKHRERHMMLFNAPENIVVYEQSDQKSVFASPESFEIIDMNGSVDGVHPVLLRYFQVSDQRQKIAESNLTGISAVFSQYDGYSAYQLLRPLRGQTYCALFQFNDEQHLSDFKKSSVYRENFSEQAVKNYLGADFMSNINFTKILTPFQSQ